MGVGTSYPLPFCTRNKKGKPVASNVMDLIAKLYRKAESAKELGSLAEAEAFASKVSQLLLEHKLEMSDIDLSEQDKTEPVGAEYWRGTKRRRVPWEIELATILARYHFCRIFTPVKSNDILWVGRPSDRQVAMFLFTTLIRELERIQNREYVKIYYRGTDLAAGFREGFRRGALNAISKRLYDLRKSAVTSENAIVLVNNADAAVNKYCDQKYRGGKGVKIGFDSNANNHGYAVGQRAGNSVNLRPNPVGANSQRSLR